MSKAAPTLNQADVNLLKSVFTTKEDLAAMESRQDNKYATKQDLVQMESRQDKKYATKQDLKTLVTKKDLEKAVEDIYLFFAKFFKNIRLEERLNDHDDRIKSLEQKSAFL